MSQRLGTPMDTIFQFAISHATAHKCPHARSCRCDAIGRAWPARRGGCWRCAVRRHTLLIEADATCKHSRVRCQYNADRLECNTIVGGVECLPNSGFARHRHLYHHPSCDSGLRMRTAHDGSVIQYTQLARSMSSHVARQLWVLLCARDDCRYQVLSHLCHTTAT